MDQQRFLFCYWLIEPTRGGIVDDGSLTPAIKADYKLNGRDCAFSFFCDDLGYPWFIKLVLPDIGSDKIPDWALPIISMVPEHWKSILNVVWSPGVSYFPLPTFVVRNCRDSVGVVSRLRIPDHPNFAPIPAGALFAATVSFREEFKLFSDGVNEVIPEVYRYLALYKLYEGFYRPSGRWDNERVDGLMASLQWAEEEMGLKKTLRAEMADIRDRCAHSIIGSGKPGIRALSHMDMNRLRDMLAIGMIIGRDIINTLADGKFQLPLEMTRSQRLGLIVPREVEILNIRQLPI